jgi:poly(hydroxyalkanoate) depolymerase family esterase
VIRLGRRLGLLSALLACLLAAGMPAAAASDAPSAYNFFRGGARDYWLFTPGGKTPARGRPMVVYLHGCSQHNETDPQVAFGTRWNELAAKVGAVVLYPLQAPYDMEHPEALEGNGGSCWNWFLPKNMRRGRGEPKLIADLTRKIAAQHSVDSSRIYVMGVSAGANMANTLSVTYPELFRASAMAAGCAYAACRDVFGNQARQQFGPLGRKPGPSIVFQGDADTLNNVAMAETLLQQQIGMRRIPSTPRSTRHYGDARAVNPGSGNPCVGPHANWPCAAGVIGWSSYPYTVKQYADRGGRTVVEWWVIHGLGHNYPNGDYASTFTDPVGPDITTAAWRFFTAA